MDPKVDNDQSLNPQILPDADSNLIEASESDGRKRRQSLGRQPTRSSPRLSNKIIKDLNTLSSRRKRSLSMVKRADPCKRRRKTCGETSPERKSGKFSKRLMERKFYGTDKNSKYYRKARNEKLKDSHRINWKGEPNSRTDSLARFGKNFYMPSLKQRTGLKPIYIDGSNVAFSHGQNERFSVRGLQICIDYFKRRGHKVIAFVPHYRLRKGKCTNPKLLHRLVLQKLVVTTPTLYIQNERRIPYDDWYVVQSAAANSGIIVSSDNFQDIIKWNPNLRNVIEECRLVPTFVDDMLIFPVDPHGNRKNNLEQFLRF